MIEVFLSSFLLRFYVEECLKSKRENGRGTIRKWLWKMEFLLLLYRFHENAVQKYFYKTFLSIEKFTETDFFFHPEYTSSNRYFFFFFLRNLLISILGIFIFPNPFMIHSTDVSYVHDGRYSKEC